MFLFWYWIFICLWYILCECCLLVWFTEGWLHEGHSSHVHVMLSLLIFTYFCWQTIITSRHSVVSRVRDCIHGRRTTLAWVVWFTLDICYMFLYYWLHPSLWHYCVSFTSRYSPYVVASLNSCHLNFGLSTLTNWHPIPYTIPLPHADLTEPQV